MVDDVAAGLYGLAVMQGVLHFGVRIGDRYIDPMLLKRFTKETGITVPPIVAPMDESLSSMPLWTFSPVAAATLAPRITPATLPSSSGSSTSTRPSPRSTRPVASREKLATP